MTHLLMNPAFPDLVGEWAEQEACEQAAAACANDNSGGFADDLDDPLIALVARAEIEATRLW